MFYVLFVVRKNLSELDDIRKYFNHKLSTPVFSVLGEQNQNSVDREVHRDSEMDTQQLLLKSNQLVGEVNDIIKSKPIIIANVSHILLLKLYIMKIYIHVSADLSEPQTKESFSNTHRNHYTPTESEMCVFSSVEHTTLTESENCETKNFNNETPEAKLEHISPHMSLTSEEADTRNEELNHNSLCNEDKNKEEDEVDEDDNEEFEETLIEPRPLNEVTSATDRTSPWTTVLSDPELGSLESFEAAEQHVDLTDENAVSPPITTPTPQRTVTDSDLYVWTESCENEGGHNVCVEHEDEEVFFNSTQDTRQMTDQHDSRTDTEDDSPLSSSCESSTKANSEHEKDESKVKLYPFCIIACDYFQSFRIAVAGQVDSACSIVIKMFFLHVDVYICD